MVLAMSVYDYVILAGLGGVALAYIVYSKKQKPKETPRSVYTVMAPSTGVSADDDVDDSSFVARMKSKGRNIVIFYGSQTGTAEDFANRLAKESVRYGMKALPCDPEECDMTCLPELANLEKSLAVFCLATYGEGDPTDNLQMT